MKLTLNLEKHRCFGMIAVFLLLVHATILTSQEPTEQIQNEIWRLKDIVNSSFSQSQNDKTKVQNYLDELENAEALLQGGYHYFGLIQLQKVHYGLMAWINLLENPEIVKGGQQAFNQEWENVDKRMKEKEQDIALDKLKLPAAIKAMAQASLNQARPYYHSSRLLSRNTGIEGGLYYIGRALAHLDFALFCQQLKFSETRPAPITRSLEPELMVLEKRVVAGYQQPGFGKAEKEIRYNKFIGANMTIKMVRELEQRQYALGALYQYLEALLSFEIIDKEAPTLEELPVLKRMSDSLFQRLSAPEIDHSIGLLYWQMAMSDLKKINPDNFDGELLKSCSVIFERILPEYFRLIETSN